MWSALKASKQGLGLIHHDDGLPRAPIAESRFLRNVLLKTQHWGCNETVLTSKSYMKYSWRCGGHWGVARVCRHPAFFTVFASTCPSHLISSSNQPGSQIIGLVTRLSVRTTTFSHRYTHVYICRTQSRLCPLLPVQSSPPVWPITIEAPITSHPLIPNPPSHRPPLPSRSTQACRLSLPLRGMRVVTTLPNPRHPGSCGWAPKGVHPPLLLPVLLLLRLHLLGYPSPANGSWTESAA